MPNVNFRLEYMLRHATSPSGGVSEFGGGKVWWCYRNDFSLRNYNSIYKDSHNEVTPYNFNINLLVKI